MFCVLTPEQIRGFFEYTHTNLLSRKSEPFTFEDIAKEVYGMVLSKSKNEGLALTYVSLLPKNILTSDINDDDAYEILKANNIDKNKLSDLIRQWKDINKVRDFMSGILTDTKGSKVQTLINQVTNVNGSFTPEYIYEEIEAENAVITQADLFVAKPDTAFATTGQESVSTDNNKIDPSDTNRIRYYNTNKALKLAQSEQNVSYDKLVLTKPDGTVVRGVKVTVVHSSQIPTDNMYKDTQAEIAKGRDFKDGIYVVVSDAEGNLLKFNEAGQLNDEGKFAITQLRKPTETAKGSGLFKLLGGTEQDQIQSPAELSRNIRKATLPDGSVTEDRSKIESILYLKQQNQFKVLHEMRNFINKNNEERITLPISEVTDGYIKTDLHIPSEISKLNIPNLNFTLAENDTSTGLRKGGVYFSIPGLVKNELVIRPNISHQLAVTIAELAFSKSSEAIKGIKTVDWLKSMVYTDKTDLYFQYNPHTGQIETTIKIDGKGDKPQKLPNDMYGRDMLIQELKKRRLNISKDFLNRDFINIEFKDGKFESTKMPYNEFVRKNFLTRVQGDSEGNVKPLNSYIKFDGPDLQNLVELKRNAAKEAKTKRSEAKKLNTVPSTEEHIRGLFDQLVAGLPITEFSKEDQLLLNDPEVFAKYGPKVDAPVQPTATDNKVEPKSVKKKRNPFEGMNKSKELDNTATEAQIEAAVDWYENHPMSKYIPFQTAFNIVNSNAYATWTQHGITLYAGSNFTDLYHEAWHGFSQMYLTAQDKSRLYNEARNIDGLKDKNDLDIEEILAEDFRKYVLSGSRNVLESRPVRNSLFRRIYNFLRSLFGNHTYQELQSQDEARREIQEMYDKLYTGQINTYSPSTSNIQFGILNKGIEGKEGSQLSNAESALVSESIDSIIRDFLNDGNKDVSFLYDNKYALPIAYKNAKEEMKDKIEEATPEQARILQFAVDNWDKVREYHNSKSKYLGSATNIRFEFDKDGNVVDDTKEENDDTDEDKIANQSKDSLGAKGGNEESVKEMANNETLYLVHGLQQKNSDGTPVLNELGFPKLVDFYTTWNKLIKTLEGTLTPQEMQGKLEQSSNKYPEFADLAVQLGDTEEFTSDTQFNTWMKFWQDLNKTRVPIWEGLVEATGDGGLLYKFSEAKPATTKVKANFTDHFQTRLNNIYTGVNATGQNILNVNKVFEDFAVKVLSTAKKDREVNGVLVSEDEIPYTLDIPDNKKKDFLKAIGFNLSDKPEINDIIKQSDLSYISKALDILNKAGREITDPIEALTTPDKKLNLGGEGRIINRLMEAEAKYSDFYSNYSVINAEGNSEYEHSLNNFFTITLNHLNNVNRYPTYQNLISNKLMSRFNIETNPMMKHSIWLNSLFNLSDTVKGTAEYGQRRVDKEGKFVQIQLANFNGVKYLDKSNSSATEGIKTTSLDINSKFLQDLHSMLGYGMMELPRHASKSSAFAVRLTQLNTSSASFNQDSHLYFPMRDFITPSNQIDGYVHDVLKGYLLDEMNRISRAVNDLEKNKVDRIRDINKLVITEKDKNKVKELEKEREDLIKEAQGDGWNIPGYNNRSFDFSFFDDILSDTTKKSLLLIADTTTPDKHADLISGEGDKKISVDFKNYFDKLVNQNLDVLKNSPNLSKELIIKVEEIVKNLNLKPYTDEQTQAAIVRAYTYNAWVNNAESIKFLYGDLAFFKTQKEEFHKRNTAYSATGTISATDSATVEFINSKGRGVAKTLGLKEKQFDGTFDVAVLKDANFKSAYYDLYSKYYEKHFEDRYKNIADEKERKDLVDKAVQKVLDPYSKMTEGDAQGWITLDSYRIFKMTQGQWNGEMENLYQQSIGGQIDKTRKIADFFPPIKAQYAGPITTQQLAVPGFHKFSLVPLIPSVIKGTSFEHINNNFIKQGIDYGVFESGSKLATLTDNGEYDKMYEDYSKRSPYTGEYTKNNIALDYLKEQVKIDPHLKGKVIFSTQLRKLILNGLFKEGVAINPAANLLANKFENQISRLTELRKQQLLKETGITQVGDTYNIKNYKPLVETLHRELSSRDLPDHVIDFVDLTPDGKLKYPLDLSTHAQKIEGMLQAIINNRLIRQKSHGDALIQLSGSGFEFNQSTIKYTKASEEDLNKYGTNDLPTYTPEGRTTKDGRKVTSAMKVKVAMNGDFTNLLELNKVKDLVAKEGITAIEALNKLIKDEEWLNIGDNRKMITMTGVRIPVQGLNSMEFMEIHHFLPTEAGNIIIPPSEIVAKSGSDFDIDKLTIFKPNISKIGNNITYYNEKMHSYTNDEIYEMYKERVRIAQKDKEAMWSKVTQAFTRNLDNSSFSNSEKALIKNINSKFNSNEKSIENNIDALNSIYTNVMVGRTTMSYDDFDNIMDELDKNRSDLKILRKEYIDNIKQYTEVFKDEHKPEYDKLEDRVQELYLDRKALQDSNIKALENSIILSIRQILEMPENFLDLVRPNETDIVKPIADALGKVLAERGSYNSKESLLNGDISKTVSPTRLLETRYNLYKHESNNIGKATLGVGAIDNTFNSILNRAGAYLNTSYRKQDSKGKITNIPTRILLAHNTMNIGDQSHISLSSIYDSEGTNKIADVISQLMNGWVDIEKEAWIFNVNGGMEAAPVILLLNQAGVPFNLIARFVTQPSIMDYVAKIKSKKDLFDIAATPENSEKYKYYASTVKKDIFGKLLGITIGNASKISELVDPSKFKDLFTREGLANSIGNSKQQAAILQHFLELSEIAGGITEMKSALNFDTNKSKDVFTSQLKKNKFENAKFTNLVPGHVLDKLRYNSVISSFAVQDLSISLGEQLMPLRNSPLMNKYITQRLEDIPLNIRSKNTERMARVFKNDFVQYIFQNQGLDKSYNWQSLFKGKNPLGTRLVDLKGEYPKLVEEYKLLQNLVRNQSKDNPNLVNIKLLDAVLDTDRINQYHDEFKKLVDPDILKSDNPIDQKKINNFFKELAVFGFLQSGLNKSPISFTEVIPQDFYTKRMEVPIRETTQNLNQALLQDFYYKFKTINNSIFGEKQTTKQEPYRFKDYTSEMTLNESIAIDRNNFIAEIASKPYSDIVEDDEEVPKNEASKSEKNIVPLGSSNEVDDVLKDLDGGCPF